MSEEKNIVCLCECRVQLKNQSWGICNPPRTNSRMVPIISSCLMCVPYNPHMCTKVAYTVGSCNLVIRNPSCPHLSLKSEMDEPRERGMLWLYELAQSNMELKDTNLMALLCLGDWKVELVS